MLNVWRFYKNQGFKSIKKYNNIFEILDVNTKKCYFIATNLHCDAQQRCDTLLVGCNIHAAPLFLLSND